MVPMQGSTKRISRESVSYTHLSRKAPLFHGGSRFLVEQIHKGLLLGAQAALVRAAASSALFFRASSSVRASSARPAPLSPAAPVSYTHLLIAGIVLSVVGMLLLRPVALMLGAEGEMLDLSLIHI